MVTSCLDFPPPPPPPPPPPSFSPREGGPGVVGLVTCEGWACFEPAERGGKVCFYMSLVMTTIAKQRNM